jgi:hypothetical protein
MTETIIADRDLNALSGRPWIHVGSGRYETDCVPILRHVSAIEHPSERGYVIQLVEQHDPVPYSGPAPVALGPTQPPEPHVSVFFVPAESLEEVRALFFDHKGGA